MIQTVATGTPLAKLRGMNAFGRLILASATATAISTAGLVAAQQSAQQLLERGAWDKDFVEKHCAFRADGDAHPDADGYLDRYGEIWESCRRVAVQSVLP